MIDAKNIGLRQRTLDPGRPPGVILGSHLLPAVERIAPSLAQRPQIVGRHTGHHSWLEICVQVVKVGTRPAIGAVMGDENRQVAHDGHTLAVRIGLQRSRLDVKLPLHELPEGDFSGMGPARRQHCLGIAPCQARRPIPPGRSVQGRADCHEQRIVVKPVLLFGAPGTESLTVDQFSLGKKALSCGAQLLFAPGQYRCVIDMTGIEPAGRQQR